VISLDSPVTTVLGARGKKAQAVVDTLGLRTVGDLLDHFPRRYLRTAELTDVSDAEEGQQLVVVGEIASSKLLTYTDRRTGRTAYRVETMLRTGGGPSLQMTFFAKHHHMAKHFADQMREGQRGLFTGQARVFRNQWQLTNPRRMVFGRPDDPVAELDPADRATLATLRGLYPIYPLTKNVDSWDLQRAISFARTVIDEIPDLLPDDVRAEHDLVDARTAYDWIHAPGDHDEVRRAQRRFRFEEALVTQLVLARRRRAVAALGAQARPGREGGLLDAFDARLPFELTRGQREVGEQLDAELARPHPMNRLLQGEVGSGKTVVALRAMLRVVDSGGQAALLAPTEVLAQQHHRSMTALLGDLAAGGMLGGADDGTTVALLTGSMTRAQRREALLGIAGGEAGIVVGTHALLEEQVTFADLGLVVVDEQHRFGVEQRAALTDKAGSPPHVLVMTATPIPRTVAMTVFGDLETSTLAELPAGRAPIQTNVVPVAEQPHWIDRAWERVREEVGKGHQVYVVCPRITGDVQEQGETDQVDLDEDGEPAAPRPDAPATSRPDALTAVEELVSTAASRPTRRTAPCAPSPPETSTCSSPRP
jgi:ATP-dependent DNA helicase RecG